MLDACVLYPAPLRDLLLSLAAAGLYRPRSHRRRIALASIPSLRVAG